MTSPSPTRARAWAFRSCAASPRPHGAASTLESELHCQGYPRHPHRFGALRRLAKAWKPGSPDLFEIPAELLCHTAKRLGNAAPSRPCASSPRWRVSACTISRFSITFGESRKDKKIQQAHAAVQGCWWQIPPAPGSDDRLETSRGMRIEIDRWRRYGPAPDAASSFRPKPPCLQRVDVCR